MDMHSKLRHLAQLHGLQLGYTYAEGAVAREGNPTGTPGRSAL